MNFTTVKVRLAATLAAVFMVSACGGGDVTTGTSGVTLFGLSDTTNTSPVAVMLLSRTGSMPGTYATSTGVVTAGATTASAIVGGVNADLDYVRITDTGSVAILETTGTIGLTAATYNGSALVRVTDVGASTVYDGTATATMSVDFANLGNSSISYSNFSGTRQIGVGAATTHSGGSVLITGITATSSGLAGGDLPTTTGFGGTTFTLGTLDLNGLFAGPDASEVGGIATASATGGELQSTFVGKR